MAVQNADEEVNKDDILPGSPRDTSETSTNQLAQLLKETIDELKRQ